MSMILIPGKDLRYKRKTGKGFKLGFLWIWILSMTFDDSQCVIGPEGLGILVMEFVLQNVTFSYFENIARGLEV